MKNVLILFGGKSPEHEVSIITGLQVFEHIDRNLYHPIPVYISPQDELFTLKPIYTRKDFSLHSRTPVSFWYDQHQGKSYLCVGSKKVEIYCAINALHGGGGESGYIAGLLETYNIPYTSSKVESSVLCMNKKLAKNIVAQNEILIVPFLSFSYTEIKNDVQKISEQICQSLALPVILKPVHLGSSIGIKIARTPVEVELGLLEISHLDDEVLVENFLENILEFNCSVRTQQGVPQASEIERPLLKSEILDFAEKYQKGGKKTQAGMGSFSRELPAKISSELYSLIQDLSIKIYQACKCKGVVRIDFIQSNGGVLYFNEINPIPGSFAFYLWESFGISFKQQITDLVEESLFEKKHNTSLSYVHHTDIIEKFINS